MDLPVGRTVAVDQTIALVLAGCMTDAYRESVLASADRLALDLEIEAASADHAVAAERVDDATVVRSQIGESSAAADEGFRQAVEEESQVIQDLREVVAEKMQISCSAVDQGSILYVASPYTTVVG